MKAAFLTATVSRLAGGLFVSVRRLAQTLCEADKVEVSVLALRDQHTDADLERWHPLVPQVSDPRGPRAFGYSAALRRQLEQVDPDLVHVQGLWTYPSLACLNWHRRSSRPYLISPRGMLDPWALANSRWKKNLAGWLYEKAHLHRAACLHALCESEARSLRAYGLHNPICVIPNGIDLPVLQDYETTRPGDNETTRPQDYGTTGPQGHETTRPRDNETTRPQDYGTTGREVRGPWSVVSSPVVAQSVVGGLKADGRKVLLYLGRIHPKKGLVNLLKAWKQVSGQWSVVSGQPSEWTLAIAGWDQGGHEDELKRLASELEIPWADVRRKTEMLKAEMLKGENTQSQEPGAYFSVSESQRFSVLFLGPQFGEAKTACYRACDAFILPSFSEGLPMAILEAWAHGKPVVMTPECNLPEGVSAGAALSVSPNEESITKGLLELCGMSDGERQAMGRMGRELVAKEFTWQRVAQEMRTVYEWVLGSGPKPDSVRD